jgi:cardiolipin synthase
MSNDIRSKKIRSLLTLPNILTLSRIVLIPVMIFCFFLKNLLGTIGALSIFVFCSISDFLDGYLARAFKQMTKLGQILDPIADKLLITTTLILVIGFGLVSRWATIPAAIIMCREIMVSEIREAALSMETDFKTSWLAKWKTATQMIAICTILSTPFFPWTSSLSILGEVLLNIAAMLAIYSAILYFKEHWVILKARHYNDK